MSAPTWMNMIREDAARARANPPAPVDLVDCFALEPHPAADLFPRMSDAEIEDLAADIDANGLRQPIVVLKWQVLDGRNRLRACELADVQPTFTTFDGVDPVAFVVSVNLKRRHLSESQRAIVAGRIATMRRGANQYPEDGSIAPPSQEDAAGLLSVSRESVKRARAVLEHGAPELVEAVDAGRVAVSTAATLTELPAQEQVEVVARGEAEILAKAKAIRDRKRAQRIANDAYYTPDPVALACVRALVWKPKRGRAPLVLEPSVGGGAFARAVRSEWNARVTGVDVVEDVPGFEHCDDCYVADFVRFVPTDRPDWVLGNVPYNVAESHVRHALSLKPKEGVAFLLRLGFLESQERESFWVEHPPTEVLVLTERPSFTGGSTDATSYGWFIWRTGFKGTPTLGWIR